MSRLLTLSNRLPVTLRVSGGDVALVPSTGGLTTALGAVHERNGGLWIGWPGAAGPLGSASTSATDRLSAGVADRLSAGVADRLSAGVADRLAALRAVPVHLDAQEVDRYYDGFANGALWPLLHHFVDTAHLDDEDAFETYAAVNQRFADVAAGHHRPGDVVWVHDYHLMLVPEMIRRALPRARIGFFLHTPFPSAEVLRLLPSRERLLRGLLGADVIGFQTASYRDHFFRALTRLLGVEPDPGGDEVTHEGRRVRLGVYPIGIDAGALGELAGRDAIREEARRIRELSPGRGIVLGVDRLDYTKGIGLRLAAIERLLERVPETRRVRFVQVAAPTREGVGAYEQMRRDVHERVSRINGRYGSVEGMPIHLLSQSLPAERLAALYAAADVMLVTPLRDGMNLVAKEYVASRLCDTGALVLSEFAGAAAELVEALIVNPYDTGAVAGAIDRALRMPAAEQRARMSALRRTVASGDVHRWAQSFLDDLERADAPTGAAVSVAGASLADMATRLRDARSLALILDYDGTLVPLAPRPELARPDDDLLSLLDDLAARPGTEVHLTSGRRGEDLDRWFGSLPVHLHAEHGARSRAPGGAWVPGPASAPPWRAPVRGVMEEISARTPGCLLEEKTTAVAWHHRAVEAELARDRLTELSGRLASLLIAHDLEIVRGHEVLEVRARGVHKGCAALRALAHAPEGTAILAAGDDRTDEDTFAALPSSALTIHVGPGESRAAYRLPDPAAVRRLLRSLTDGPTSRAEPSVRPAPAWRANGPASAPRSR